MNYINPLANALPQSFATQQEMSAERARRARGTPTPSRTLQADQFEHQVESPEEAAAIHEETRQKRQQRGRRERHLQDETAEQDGEPPHIDLKA